MESYGNPIQLHKLEARINSGAMKDIFTREPIEYNPSILITDDWLWLRYLTFLNRVMRFQAVKCLKVYSIMDLI